MLALVNIVSEEHIILSVNVSLLTWSLPDVEESHQIDILAMNITKDLAWWSDVLDDDRLSSKNLKALIGELNNVLSLARELGIRLDFLTLFGFQERLEEHLTQGIVRVLIDLNVVSLVRIELFWLLCKFIDGDLSNDHREVLSVMLWHIASLGTLSSNDSVSTKLESLVHSVDVLLVLLDSLLFIFLTFFTLILSRFDLLKE